MKYALCTGLVEMFEFYTKEDVVIYSVVLCHSKFRGLTQRSTSKSHMILGILSKNPNLHSGDGRREQCPVSSFVISYYTCLLQELAPFKSHKTLPKNRTVHIAKMTSFRSRANQVTSTRLET